MPQIIISFTSYPARIQTVNKVLDSIIRQTVLPDKIILYLSSCQFPAKAGLPDFSLYEKYGFEISWHEEDIGAHKKYYYAMQQYPKDTIITIDDDFYYEHTMIEEFINYHKKFPKAVLARRAHVVTWMQDGNIAPYNSWYFESFTYIGVPRMDLLATGCSGILYPPNIFNPEVFNKNMFMKKAPYADDIWLKIMELYSNIPVVLVKPFINDSGLEGYVENGLFNSYNADGGNDIQLHALLEAYGKGEGDGSYLLRRLACNGKLMLEDCAQQKKRDIWRMINVFFKENDNRESLLVYGAGVVAGKICKVFKRTNKLNKIKSFIVDCVEENAEELEGIIVRDYRDFIYASEKIIIGLSAEKQERVYDELLVAGISEKRLIKLPQFINKLLAAI